MLYVDNQKHPVIVGALQRVLVLEPHAASMRMIIDLLKNLGARAVMTAANSSRALSIAASEDPQMIFTEYAGEDVDGLEFARAVRRSDMACRRAPIIMISAEATAQSIIGARNAGVHEFLRKPYTMKDLSRRIEAVATRPRDWVEAVRYIGPDRRRFNSGDYSGPMKRKSDAKATPQATRVDQALRILKSAIGAIESDPKQALRAMQAQAVDLTKAAVAMHDSAMASGAAALQHRLQEAVASGALDRPAIEAAAKPLWRYMSPDSEKSQVA